MYERKIPIELTSGMMVAMAVVGTKWKLCLIEDINRGIRRPKDLLESVQGLSKRVLHQQLKELEFYAIVEKKEYDEVPKRVEYLLTEAGKSLLPIVESLNQWGERFAPSLKEMMANENK